MHLPPQKRLLYSQGMTADHNAGTAPGKRRLDLPPAPSRQLEAAPALVKRRTRLRFTREQLESCSTAYMIEVSLSADNGAVNEVLQRC